MKASINERFTLIDWVLRFRDYGVIDDKEVRKMITDIVWDGERDDLQIKYDNPQECGNCDERAIYDIYAESNSGSSAGNYVFCKACFIKEHDNLHILDIKNI
jgi:hypothetical protein